VISALILPAVSPDANRVPANEVSQAATSGIRTDGAPRTSTRAGNPLLDLPVNKPGLDAAAVEHGAPTAITASKDNLVFEAQLRETHPAISETKVSSTSDSEIKQPTGDAGKAAIVPASPNSQMDPEQGFGSADSHGSGAQGSLKLKTPIKESQSESSSKGPAATPEPASFATVTTADSKSVSPKSDAVIPSSKPGAQPMDQQMPNGPTTKTDLTMRLQGQSGENINVRVFERGGEIQVAVRSSDPAVTNMIRHELPGLQGNLEHAGWQMGNVNTSGQSQQDRESEGSRQQHQERDQAGSQSQQQRKSREDEFFELSL
jgi:hypothetical protein